MSKDYTIIAQVGWKVPQPTRDSFKIACDQTGANYGSELAGAMWLWFEMPAYIRELVKAHAFGSGDAESAQVIADFVAGLDQTMQSRIRSLADKQG